MLNGAHDHYPINMMFDLLKLAHSYQKQVRKVAQGAVESRSLVFDRPKLFWCVLLYRAQWLLAFRPFGAVPVSKTLHYIYNALFIGK